jgi:hypothetical protein
MYRFVIAVITVLNATAAHAEGIALKDLTKLTFDPATMPGKTFIMRNDEPDHATLACLECDPLEAVDILLGTSTDSTEQRFRSGETTLATLEEQCKSRAPDCTLQAANFGRAIGWTSQFEAGKGFGSTTLLFLDGDTLTLRSLAGTRKAALANGLPPLAV